MKNTKKMKGVIRTFDLWLFINYLSYSMLAIGTLALLYTDYRYRIIPDWVQVLVLVSGIINFQQPSAWGTLLGPAFGYLILSDLAKNIPVGMGDIKLFTAVGSWVGIWIVPVTILSILIFLASSLLYEKLIVDERPGYPFGPAIIFSALIAIYVSCIFG